MSDPSLQIADRLEITLDGLTAAALQREIERELVGLRVGELTAEQADRRRELTEGLIAVQNQSKPPSSELVTLSP